MSHIVDLGGGHTLRSFTKSNVDGVAGYTVEHPDMRDPTKPCWGAVDLNFPGWNEGWDVVQAEPLLTLSPSLQCLTCGDHGFVRDGKWVTA